ncbi:unnamed protein product [Chrysoparadoxa australica]
MKGSAAIQRCSAVSGGGVCSSSPQEIIMEGNSTIKDSAAEEHGGGIFQFATPLSIKMIGNASIAGCSAEKGGGGIYTERNGSIVTMDDTASITNNRASAGSGGGLYLRVGGLLEMNGAAEISRNAALEGGGVLLRSPNMTDSEAILSMWGSSHMSHNSATSGGGGACRRGCFIALHEQARIDQNTAREYGGGFYLDTRDPGEKLTFQGQVDMSGDGTFSSNDADEGGAVYIPGNSSVTLNCGLYEANKATYGGAVWVGYNSFFKSTGLNYTKNEAQRSGGAVLLNPSPMMTSNPFDEESVFLENSASCCMPGLEGPLLGKIPCVDVDMPAEVQGPQAQCCVQGEYRNETSCTKVLCELEEHLECVNFDIGVSIRSLPVKKGYWRANLANSKTRRCLYSEACKGFDAKVFLAGAAKDHLPNVTELYCEDGYEGPYCSVCSLNYTRGRGYSCFGCESAIGWALFSFTIFIMLLSLVILLVLFASLQGCGIKGDKYAAFRRHQHDEVFSPSDSGRQPAPHEEQPNRWTRFKAFLFAFPIRKLKIPIIAFQIVSQFSEVTSADYPPIFTKFLGFLDVLSFDFSLLLSGGCKWTLCQHEVLLISTLLPLGFFLLLFISYRVFVRRMEKLGCKRRNWQARAKADHMRAGLIVLVLVYPIVSSVVLSSFRCDELDEMDGAPRYLRSDYSIRCDDPWHYAWIAYASVMLLYPFGTPIYFFLLVRADRSFYLESERKKREAEKLRLRSVLTRAGCDRIQGSTRHLTSRIQEQVEREREEEKLGSKVRFSAILCHDYRKEGLSIYYEVIECWRRVALTGVLVFTQAESVAQNSLAATLSVLSLAVFARCDPFIDPTDTSLYLLGSLIIFITMMMGLLGRVPSTEETAEASSLSLAIVTIFLSLLLLAASISVAVLTIAVGKNFSEDLQIAFIGTVVTSKGEGEEEKSSSLFSTRALSRNAATLWGTVRRSSSAVTGSLSGREEKQPDGSVHASSERPAERPAERGLRALFRPVNGGDAGSDTHDAPMA